MMAMICDVISKVGLTPFDTQIFHWFPFSKVVLGRRSHLAMMKLGRFALWASARWGHLEGDSSARQFFPQSLQSYCGFRTHLRLVRWNIASDIRWLFLLVFLDQWARIMVSNYLTAQEIGECLQNPSKHQAVFCFDTLQRVCATVQPVFAYLTLYEVFWKPWHAVAVLNHGKTTGKW